MGQSFLYNRITGEKKEIDKQSFLHELNKVYRVDVDSLSKLSYEEIVKRYANLRIQDKGIYTCQISDDIIAVCLLDKTFEYFDVWCKKKGLPVKNDNNLILFHGSKQGIKGDIKPVSRFNCDFGRGFYLGENKWQTEQLCSFGPNPTLYKVTYNDSGLKVFTFEKDYSWVLFIALNREIPELYNYPKLVNYLKHKYKGYDVLIGTIADDVFTQTLSNFFNNLITFETLVKCLDMYDYGTQYCFTTQKSCNAIKILNSYKLSEEQILKYKQDRSIKKNKVVKETLDIVKQNTGKPGMIFDDILKEFQL